MDLRRADSQQKLNARNSQIGLLSTNNNKNEMNLIVGSSSSSSSSFSVSPKTRVPNYEQQILELEKQTNELDQLLIQERSKVSFSILFRKTNKQFFLKE